MDLGTWCAMFASFLGIFPEQCQKKNFEKNPLFNLIFKLCSTKYKVNKLNILLTDYTTNDDNNKLHFVTEDFSLKTIKLRSSTIDGIIYQDND